MSGHHESCEEKGKQESDSSEEEEEGSMLAGETDESACAYRRHHQDNVCRMLQNPLGPPVLPSGMKSEEAKDDQQWQFPCSRHSGAFGALQMERVSEGCFFGCAVA